MLIALSDIEDLGRRCAVVLLLSNSAHIIQTFSIRCICTCMIAPGPDISGCRALKPRSSPRDRLVADS
jgi:hypothetical protein